MGWDGMARAGIACRIGGRVLDYTERLLVVYTVYRPIQFRQLV